MMQHHVNWFNDRNGEDYVDGHSLVTGWFPSLWPVLKKIQSKEMGGDDWPLPPPPNQGAGVGVSLLSLVLFFGSQKNHVFFGPIKPCAPWSPQRFLFEGKTHGRVSGREGGKSEDEIISFRIM